MSEVAAKYPLVGGVTSGGAGVISYMGTLTPYLEFTTLMVGLVIGLITLYGLVIKQLREDKRERLRNNK